MSAVKPPPEKFTEQKNGFKKLSNYQKYVFSKLFWLTYPGFNFCVSEHLFGPGVLRSIGSIVAQPSLCGQHNMVYSTVRILCC